MNGESRLTTSTRCPVYVGQNRSIAAIRVAASAAPSTPSILVVSGAAGIGKSRFAGEATALARALGHTVLEAGCHAGAPIPYEPYVALMRRALRRRDRVETRQLFRGTARFAATLLPEMAEGVDAVRAVELDPQHIDAAVVEVLARMVEGERGLLCLEDLHWAGGDTVRVLTNLVREVESLPLWVVVTYRDDEVGDEHVLAPLLTEARRSDTCSFVELGPLRDDDVAGMVAAMLGTEVATTSLVARIASRSQGNPLFIEELCARLADVDAHDEERGAHVQELDMSTVSLPASLRESVLTRLRAVDAVTREALVLAAVAGETIDPLLLQQTAGADAAAVDAALTAGIERQLVVERMEMGLPVYAFRHALTREAIITDLSGPARRAAHRRIASALAAATVPERAGEAADHHAAAGDAAAAHEFALAAARFAAQRGAAAECRRRYEQALRLSGTSAIRLATFVEAAETLRAADPDAAEAFVVEGSALARSSGDKLALARLLVAKAVMTWWRGDSQGASHAFAEAYNLVCNRWDAWEFHILLELARAHANRDEIEPAARLLERGRELLAAGVGERRDAAELLTVAALLGRGDVERMQRYDAALEAAANADDPAMECVALADAGFAALWWPGDLRRAKALLGRAAEIADAVRPANAVAYRAATAWTDALAGNLEAAAAAAAAVLARTQSPPSRLMALLALHEVHERRCEWDRAATAAADARTYAETTGEPQWIVPAIAASARTRLRAGIETALPLFKHALRDAAGVQPHWYATPDLARALHAAGATEALRAWADEVAELATVGEHHHDGAAWRLCAGLSALALDRVDDAHRLLTEARAWYRSMPCVAREAEALLALARLHQRTGEGTEAVHAATAALGLAERLRSPGLIDESRAVLRRAGIRSRPAAAPEAVRRSSSLSPRESEVASLVAAGLSNAEIARSLFLSENTVERHVSNILAKLGLTRRAQVAAWAAAQAGGNDGFP